MPLPKRSIDPVHVARSVYQQDELQSVELETVTNTTLTNIIRQLSSLSKHAEDVFGELARDVGNIGDRANSLQARIDRLAIKVTQLDSTVEEVPLTDITRKKAFKSAKNFDQQIFSRDTMPAPMLETYSQCDKPPPLHKLNIYRDDGKDGLKFYTDPNYFFELWRQEMIKDTERVMHDKGKKTHRPRQDGNNGAGARGHKKRVRTPHNTREKQRLIAIGHGETIMPNNVIYRTPNSIIGDQTESNGIPIYHSRALRPNSIELRRNYQSEQIDGSYGAIDHLNTSLVSSSVYPYDDGLQLNQQIQHIYGDGIYHTQQSYPLNGIVLPEPGTPSRTKPRPSQPPPAPPANGSGTPTASNANTPTRGRSMSTSRDALPPPPPVPDNLTQSLSPSQLGSGNVAAKLLARTNSTSRAGSPQLAPSNSVQDANALVLAQLNNTFGNINIGGVVQSVNDFPPPPPVIDQNSPKMSPNSAPPPPPPPPMPDDNISPQISTINQSKTATEKHVSQMIMTGLPHVIGVKKILPPSHDNRTDLMKAIRDGITLRKVEKSELKEIERNTALHDVASILARRVAIELSESEESESDDDSEGWMEPNETSA